MNKYQTINTDNYSLLANHLTISRFDSYLKSIGLFICTSAGDVSIGFEYIIVHYDIQLFLVSIPIN